MSDLFELITAALSLARVAVGAVLLIAGIAKLWAGTDRAIRAVLGYELLPSRLALPAARVLPWTEILIGVALMSGQANAVASFAGALLLAIFAVAMAVNLVRGRTNECGCLGTRRIQWRLVARNLLLAALLVPNALSGFLTAQA